MPYRAFYVLGLKTYSELGRKTLEEKPQKSYYIVMKKYIYLFPVLCYLTFSAAGHAYAQTELGEAVRVVSKLSKTAAASGERAAAKAWRFTLPASTRKITVKDNPMKPRLKQTLSYHPEYLQARLTVGALQAAERREQPFHQFLQRNPKWKDFVVNKHLNASLDKTGGYQNTIHILALYYGLDPLEATTSLFIPADLFASSAVDYMVQHPHKMNLRLRAMLESDYGKKHARVVQRFLRKDSLTSTDKKYLYNFLKEAYEEYATIAKSDLKSPWVSHVIKSYEEAAQALESFIAETGRLPRLNAGPQEFKLAAEIELLLKNAEDNHFGPIKEAVDRLVQLKKQHPQEIWSKELFAQEYKKFLQTHPNELLPRSWHETNYSEWDAMLYESYQHYLTHEPQAIHAIMKQIQQEVIQP